MICHKRKIIYVHIPKCGGSSINKFYFHPEQMLKNLKVRKDSNLLCGNEDLPHLMVSHNWNHAAEFMLAGVMFLYITV